MKADGPARGMPSGEILTLEHLGHRDVRGQRIILHGELAQPGGVELQVNPVHVENLPELGPIRRGVGANVIPGQGFARLRAPGGVADHAREVPKDHDDVVAEVLKITELAQDHGMPQMEVRRRRIQP
jgi:hypothetical protein